MQKLDLTMQDAPKYSNLDRWQSTYKSNFQVTDNMNFQKPIVYHQPPSIENPRPTFVDGRKYMQGYIPKLMYCRPPGYNKIAPKALGLGTFTNPLIESNGKMKPITRGVQPKHYREANFQKVKPADTTEFQYHSLRKNNSFKINEGVGLKTLTISKLTASDEKLLDEIYPKAFYSSSVNRATLQSALDNNNEQIRKLPEKLEDNSDQVRYKAARYNEKVEPWQRFSTKWDRAQLRNQCARPQSAEISKKFKKLDLQQNNTLTKSIDMVPHSGQRQVPGYCGYVPRLPIIRKSDHESLDPNAVTDCHKTTTNTRTFVGHDLRKMEKAPLKVRPMSKMVTLVQPSNPFKLAKMEIDSGKWML